MTEHQTPQQPAANHYDYIIVGSGFGGSVSALRLAEKGYKVLVIERGKRYRTSDFPKRNWNLPKYLWFPAFGCYGIQAISMLKDVFILHGTGVGGGSLVWANTMLRPPLRFFKDARWSDLADWEAELSGHYETALRMLGASLAPDGAESDKVLKEIAEEMGRGDTFHRPTVSVYQGEPGKRVTDPYFGGKGPERVGCVECGGCMVGCRFGAKNTLDKNYLYLAEQLGVEVIPERLVTDVKPRNGQPEGGYEVTTRSQTSWLKSQEQTFTADKVILAGGVMGTVDLLFRCKEKGSLPKLSPQLGSEVRTNSEALLAITAQNDDRDYSRGIAISAGFYPDEDTHIETCRYSKGSDFMSVLTTVLTSGGAGLPRVVHFLKALISKPGTFLRLFDKRFWAQRTAILLVMQPIDNHIRLRRKRTWMNPLRKRLQTELGDSPGVPSYLPIANQVAERFAEKMGGIPQSGIIEVILGLANTAHILGGCPIGGSSDTGVIDAKHEVYGYPGLYVIDGSAIPANLGVNPSLTITAMAERAMTFHDTKPGAETHEPELGLNGISANVTLADSPIH